MLVIMIHAARSPNFHLHLGRRWEGLRRWSLRVPTPRGNASPRRLFLFLGRSRAVLRQLDRWGRGGRILSLGNKLVELSSVCHWYCRKEGLMRVSRGTWTQSSVQDVRYHNTTAAHSHTTPLLPIQLPSLPAPLFPLPFPPPSLACCSWSDSPL